MKSLSHFCPDLFSSRFQVVVWWLLSGVFTGAILPACSDNSSDDQDTTGKEAGLSGTDSLGLSGLGSPDGTGLQSGNDENAGSNGSSLVGVMDQSFPDSVHGNPLISPLEQSLRDAGLQDVQDVDESVRVSLAYSTEDNFLHADVYGELSRCYLQPEVAAMVAQASSCVQERDSALRLIIFDGVRPRSVQRKMWDLVKGTDQQDYVAAPTGGGGMHNYGCAVDLGLFHVDTGLVDMGTPFDFFGELAQPRYEDQFVRQGKLSQAHVDNRRILRACMLQAGFSGILSEWWHFNAFPKEIVRERYQIVE